MDKIFEALKLSPREKKALKHLMKHEQSTSVDIQQAESLQQPEVSMATKDLLKKKYIHSEIITLDTKNGGHKAMVYSLTKDAYKTMDHELEVLILDLMKRADSYTSLREELGVLINKKEKTE